MITGPRCANARQEPVARAFRTGQVAVGDLADSLTVSEATLRRDLALLDVGEVDLLITAADAPADQVALLHAAGLDIRLVPVT